MDDEAAFVRAIRANPDDAALRLVFADWLEDRGDPRSQFVRLESKLALSSVESSEGKNLQAEGESLRATLNPEWVSKWSALVDRSDRYTMLWADSYSRGALNQPNRPLRQVWGGHNQRTDFSFMGVKPGDYLYPLRVRKKKVYVVARMKIQAVLSRQEYLSTYPANREMVDSTCDRHFLLGENGTLIRYDLAVPPQMLERMRFRSRKQERGLKYLKDGELARSVSLHGIFRLTQSSAADLDSLLDGDYQRLEMPESVP